MNDDWIQILISARGGADLIPNQTFNYLNDVWTIDQAGQWKKLKLGEETLPPTPVNTGISGYPYGAVIAGLLIIVLFSKARKRYKSMTRSFSS